MIEREADPTTTQARHLLSTAAELFAASGDPDLELTALLQLGYAVRILGDPDQIDEVMERIEALSERLGSNVAFRETDVTDAASVQAAVDMSMRVVEGGAMLFREVVVNHHMHLKTMKTTSLVPKRVMHRSVALRDGKTLYDEKAMIYL